MAIQDWITSPTSHTLYTVRLEDVESNTDGIFPDGPNPYNSAYGIYASKYASAKAAGFTVIQTGGSATTGSYAKGAAAQGLKATFPLRDFIPDIPYVDSRGHGNIPDLYFSYRDRRSEFKNMIEAYMRVILEDTEANEAVISWTPYGDDSLECWKNCYSPSGSRRSCGTYVSGDICISDVQVREAYSWLMDVVLAYDNPTGGHENGKNRGIADIPFGYAYGSLARFNDREYAKKSAVMTHQSYYILLQAGSGGVAFNKSLSAIYYEENHKRQIANAVGLPPNGKVRRIMPSLGWLTNNTAVYSRLPNSLNNVTDCKHAHIAETLVRMMAGATGILAYPYLSGTFVLGDNDYINSIFRSLHEHDLFKIIMWGNQLGGTDWTTQGNLTAGDIRRETVGGYRWWGQTEGHPDGRGTSTPLQSGEGYSTSWFYSNRIDQIIWKVIQYKESRYLIVVNGMPCEEENTYMREQQAAGNNKFAYYPTENPATNTGERARFGIRNKFHLPNFSGQVKCTELLSGANVNVTGTAPVIDVTLQPYDAKVYKFEGVPLVAPTTPTAPTFSANNVDPGDTVTLSSSTTGATSVQWQRKRSGGSWSNI